MALEDRRGMKRTAFIWVAGGGVVLVILMLFPFTSGIIIGATAAITVLLFVLGAPIGLTYIAYRLWKSWRSERMPNVLTSATRPGSSLRRPGRR
jgi:threonine/homoserine/homoserine lactone efflux protein